MQLPMKRTLQVLYDLHHALTEGALSFPIAVSRVGDGTREDLHFVSWAQSHFPAFSATVSPRSDWLGLVEQTQSPVPDVGCSQWYKLHILADGREAYCCIDAEGRWANSNARDISLLDIYNQPVRRKQRLASLSRRGMEICGRCPLLS